MDIFFASAFFVVFVVLAWLLLSYGGRWAKEAQQTMASDASDSLGAMFIFMNARQLLMINALTAIVLPAVVLLLSGNLFFTGMAFLVGLVLPRKIVAYLRRRRLSQIEVQLPDALLMLSGSIRAGASLQIGLEGVAQDGQPPLSQEFDLLLRELRVGVDFAVALKNLEARAPLPDILLMTSAMNLSRDVGANLSETLTSVANTLKSKQQLEGRIRSLTSQGKMQGVVMAGLPILLIVVLRFMEPEAMEPMFTRWYGWVVMGIIAAMTLIGYHFIRKITTIDV